jgi:Holliday junction resolvase
MTNGRQKGASFERKIGNMLLDELGIKFKRNLEQYRTKDLGDLITENNDFPFVIECKIRGKGTTYSMDWWEQVTKATQGTNKMPVLIYQLNRSPIRCVCDLNVILETFGGQTIYHQNLVELTFETFCMICREMLNDGIIRTN